MTDIDTTSTGSGLATYFEIVRARWWAVLASVLVGLLLALAVTVTTDTVYEANTRVFVNIPEAQGIEEALQGVQLSGQLMASYVELLESRPAAQDIADQLEDRVTTDEVDQAVTAHRQVGSLLIEVSARSGDPEKAAAIADAAAKQLSEIIDELETGRRDPVRGTVVEKAQVPTSPVAPLPGRNLTLGLVLGFLGGIATALALHALDRSVRTASQVIDATGAPVLADVPVSREIEPEAVFSDNRAVSEAYRVLRTSVRFAAGEESLRTLVVTSVASGDGKTTTAANLALAFARAGERVALIDADLRRPHLHEVFNVDVSPGLSEILIGEAPENVALRVVDPLVRLLPAGTAATNPAELLGGERMRRLLDRVQASADIVIIDAPPGLVVTDPVVLSVLCDGVLMVARWGRTRRSSLGDLAKRLESVDANVLGVVLNMDRKPGDAAYTYAPLYQASTPAD